MMFSEHTHHKLSPPHHFPTDISEEQWQAIQAMLPATSHLGARRRVNLRTIVNGIRYAQGTGCQWRTLPTTFGNWNTVYGYYREWKRNGTWQRVQEVLSTTLRPSDQQPDSLAIPTFPTLPSDPSCLPSSTASTTHS